MPRLASLDSSLPRQENPRSCFVPSNASYTQSLASALTASLIQAQLRVTQAVQLHPNWSPFPQFPCFPPRCAVQLPSSSPLSTAVIVSALLRTAVAPHGLLHGSRVPLSRTPRLAQADLSSVSVLPTEISRSVPRSVPRSVSPYVCPSAQSTLLTRERILPSRWFPQFPFRAGQTATLETLLRTYLNSLLWTVVDAV